MRKAKGDETGKASLERVWGRAISYRIEFDAKAYKKWLKDREKEEKEGPEREKAAGEKTGAEKAEKSAEVKSLGGKTTR